MRRLGILVGRELRAFAFSPTVWVVAALLWLFYGIQVSRGVLPQSRGDLLYFTWQGANIALVLQILLVPLLTMRLLAEERRSGTFEMLVTAPVRDHEVVLSKFLAALTVDALLWLVIPLHAGILAIGGGSPDPGPVLCSWLGVVGPGALFIALGLFASALTQHQLLAGFLGLVLILVALYVPAVAAALDPSWESLRAVLAAADLRKQTEEAARGLLDLVHLAYQGAMSGVILLYTVRVVELRKWS